MENKIWGRDERLRGRFGTVGQGEDVGGSNTLERGGWGDEVSEEREDVGREGYRTTTTTQTWAGSGRPEVAVEGGRGRKSGEDDVSGDLSGTKVFVQ